MGLGDILKAKTGAYRLDKSMLNKYTIYLLLRSGNIPFVVTLPIVEQKRRNDSLIYFDGHGHGRAFDNPFLGDNTKMRKVKANVQCTPQQVIIQHALADGRHFFIDAPAIVRVGRIKNGVWLEIHDGRKFVFETNKSIRKDFWKALGFNPDYGLDTFYNLFLNRTWERAFIKEYQCPSCNSTFIGQLPKCPNCDKLLSYGD